MASSDGPLVDRVAVSKAITAVAPDLPELAAARAAGIALESWQQLVADAAATAGQMLVGVAGTHGKSTTTGWLLHVLVEAGRDPSGFVGALMAGEGPAEPPATARLGRGDLCVVEADEYAGNFDPYRPSVAILLNAEWDHPDVFADEAAVLDAFEAWVRTMVPDASGRPPTLVVDVADAGAAAVAARLTDWPGTLVRVALADDPGTGDEPMRDGALDLQGRLLARGPSGLDLEVEGRLLAATNDEPGPVRVPLALVGRHNAANALGVIAAALVLGTALPDVIAGMGSYRGVGRRLEVKGEPDGVLVLDDYAHHPSAIRATLAAVRGEHPGSADLGGLRATDVSPDGGHARRLRRGPEHGRSRGHRRHLGGSRPGPDDRVGGRPG